MLRGLRGREPNSLSIAETELLERLQRQANTDAWQANIQEVERESRRRQKPVGVLRTRQRAAGVLGAAYGVKGAKFGAMGAKFGPKVQSLVLWVHVDELAYDKLFDDTWVS